MSELCCIFEAFPHCSEKNPEYLFHTICRLLDIDCEKSGSINIQTLLIQQASSYRIWVVNHGWSCYTWLLNEQMSISDLSKDHLVFGLLLTVWFQSFVCGSEPNLLCKCCVITPRSNWKGRVQWADYLPLSLSGILYFPPSARRRQTARTSLSIFIF